MKLFYMSFGLLFLLYMCSNNPAKTEHQNERLIRKNISAPALDNNLFETITTQPIAIYLPSSYYQSETRYPVVYFLPGFSTHYTAFLDGTFQGFELQNSMDQLIAADKINEMIVVIPNDDTFMLGCFYTNSAVRGQWMDYITGDLVHYIDSNFRTLNHASSRAIAGHSMGGFGALNIAMIHPEVYKVAYGLSPGLFDQNGLNKQGMFSNININAYLSQQQEWDAMDEEEAKSAFKSHIKNLIAQNNTFDVFNYAYGAAFSPNPNNKPPYINYPFSKSGNNILVDSTLLKNYENGFGGLEKKISDYYSNLMQLKSYTIDYGEYDEFTWIRDGSIYYSALLQNAGIPHDLKSFNGGHSDKVRNRIENSIMPVCSNNLVFE